MKKILILSVLFLIILNSCKKENTNLPNIVEDSFKNDASDWTIVGDAQGGFVIADYSPEYGVTDGYIFASDDVAGGVWFFAAPQSYKGNKQDYYDRQLSFSLYQESNMDDQFDENDVIFFNNDKAIVFDFPNNPNATWTNYTVNLNATSGWKMLRYDGLPASEDYIKQVLSNVTDFHIRGEFQTGPDVGGLDNVILKKN